MIGLSKKNRENYPGKMLLNKKKKKQKPGLKFNLGLVLFGLAVSASAREKNI